MPASWLLLILQSTNSGTHSSRVLMPALRPMISQSRNVGRHLPVMLMPSFPEDLIQQCSTMGLTFSSPLTCMHSRKPVRSQSKFCITDEDVMRNSGELARWSRTVSLSVPSPRMRTRFVTFTASPPMLCTPLSTKMRSPFFAMFIASWIDLAVFCLPSMSFLRARRASRSARHTRSSPTGAPESASCPNLSTEGIWSSLSCSSSYSS
mmetsp:Transcript_3657/g.13059  ORF Transcript_3657/g.13059 Transcript_3657/m.13059 type:complete len:207 (+) Transcript_3657:499-1119(+)